MILRIENVHKNLLENKSMKLFQKKRRQKLKRNANVNLRDNIRNNKAKDAKSLMKSKQNFKTQGKMRHFQFIKANILSIWIGVFLSIYIYFMLWICYDLFIWKKTLFEINTITIVGEASSIIFLWLGVLTWRQKDFGKGTNQLDQRYNQKGYLQSIKQISKQNVPVQQSQLVQIKNSDSNCLHYSGYLKNRYNFGLMPEECLTCEELIKCID